MRPYAIVLSLALIAFALGALPTRAQQVPHIISYQGTLTDGSGNAIDGNVNLAFRFYTTEEGGSPIGSWEEIYTDEPVSNGRFSVALGSNEALPDALLQSSDLWLEVVVNGEPLPRTQMTSSVFALRAEQAATVADEAVTNAKLAGDAVSGDKIANGAVVRSLTFQGSTINPTLTDGITLSAGNGVNFSENGSNITISAVTSDGGLVTVTSDTTLTGDGRSDGVDAQPLAIADGGVNTAKIVDNTIRSEDIRDRTIATADLAGSAVTSAKIADGSIAGVDIDANTITGDNIAGAAIDGVGAIQVEKNPSGNFEISAPNVLTTVATDGTLNGDGADTPLSLGADAAIQTISDGTNNVTGTGTVTFQGTNGINIVADGSSNTVTFNASAAGGLNSVETNATLVGDGTSGNELGLADDAVTTDQIFDGTISAADLASASVDTEELVQDAVTTDKILDGTVGAADLAPDAAVTSLTVDGVPLSGGLTLDGAGDVSISQSSETITISATPSTAGVSSLDGATGTVTLSGDVSTTLSTSTDLLVELGTGVVTTNEIQDGTVTTADLATDAVTFQKINGTLTSSVPADNNVVLTYNTVDDALSWEDPATLASSIRWKENVETLEDPLALVGALRGVRYRWKESGEADVGVIAEEVAKVLPELVEFEPDGQARGVHYAKLVAVLIEAVKVQQEEIDTMHERFETLSERVARLEHAQSASPK